MDTDPCASSPCLYGGKCEPQVGGTYTCECALKLSGRRCEYGRYCTPNPCKHGGVCEEGDEGPLCKCRAFTGEFCEYDLNECESSPCQNGGTCINGIGSFHCICPPNTTGIYCGNSLYSSSIASNIFNFTMEQLYVIAAALGGKGMKCIKSVFDVLIDLLLSRHPSSNTAGHNNPQMQDEKACPTPCRDKQ